MVEVSAVLIRGLASIESRRRWGGRRTGAASRPTGAAGGQPQSLQQSLQQMQAEALDAEEAGLPRVVLATGMGPNKKAATRAAAAAAVAALPPLVASWAFEGLGEEEADGIMQDLEAEEEAQLPKLGQGGGAGPGAAEEDDAVG